MNHDHPHEADDDSIEVFAAGSWPDISPLATLWGTNATLGERPEWATAARFLSRAMERHRTAADAYATALLTDADVAELNSATSELEESIVSLGLARTMLRDDENSEREVRVSVEDGDEDGDDLEWVIEVNDSGEFDRPPRDELPVTLALNLLLVDGSTTVRARDVRVYTEGILLTLDIAIRQESGWNTREEIDLTQRFSDFHIDEHHSMGGEQSGPELTDSRAETFARALVGWRQYWVDTRDAVEPVVIRIKDPLDVSADDWLVPLDMPTLTRARERVIDVSNAR